MFDAQVSECTIRIDYRDDDVCSLPNALHTQTHFVDLHVFEIGPGSSDIAIPAAGGWRITPRYNARPKVGDASLYLQEFSEEVLDEARAEIGWGWQAAVLASERFLPQHPVETLAAWNRVTDCSGNTWVSPLGVWFVLQSPDPAHLEAALMAYSNSCTP